MENKYVPEIVKRYFKERYRDATELKIQGWLAEEQDAELKDQVLFCLWNQVEERSDKEVYRSLDRVQVRLGMKRSHRLLIWKPLFQVVAVVLFFILIVYVYRINRVEMIEIQTVAGEQREIILPDGSRVWMNACSSMAYPEKFKGDSREVRLTGEALFAVERDTLKKFVVMTKDMMVQVLGTCFNIKAYPEDNIISTTLESGKVEVKLEDKKYILCPKQTLIYNRQERRVVIQPAEDDLVLWRSREMPSIKTVTTCGEVQSIPRVY